MVSKIKQICSEKQLTVAELERAAGIPKNSIYKWDRNAPSVKTVLKAARVLGVTVEELAGEEDI